MTYPTEPRLKVRVKRVNVDKIEALAGERRGDTPEQKAVTQGDAASLGTLVLKSAAVSAAPTAAQYNALVDDLRAIAAVLNAVGAKITWT